MFGLKLVFANERGPLDTSDDKPWKFTCAGIASDQINGLMQERRNSIANALELRLSFTNSSKCSCFDKVQ